MAKNDYVYAVARIRVLEKGLLTDSFIEQLVNTPDAAGVKRLLAEGWQVTGIDDLNYFTYPADIKYARLKYLGINGAALELTGSATAGDFSFQQMDVTETPSLKALIIDGNFDLIVHLAGMTSVSASTLSPFIFHSTIVTGLLNVLDGVRDLPPEQRPRLLYASSAAVYGNAPAGLKLSENDRNRLSPGSIYGVCKCMSEELAQTYGRLFGVQALGLRFFNIYGAFSRPDTLAHIVCESLYSDAPIPVYGHGEITHDFMYIDDCIEVLMQMINQRAGNEALTDIINVSDPRPVSIGEFISILGQIADKTPELRLMPLPQGEILSLTADVSHLRELYPGQPQTELHEGLRRYYEWFKAYRNRQGILGS